MSKSPRSELLNILIHFDLDTIGSTVHRVVDIVLRESYTPLSNLIPDEPANGRPMFRVIRERRYELQPDDIRQAVAVIRAAWGDLHVQDNTGLVPDLDQGLWRCPDTFTVNDETVSAEAVRDAREAAEISMTRAAYYVGASAEIWAEWESGARKMRKRCLDRFLEIVAEQRSYEPAPCEFQEQ